MQFINICKHSLSSTYIQNANTNMLEFTMYCTVLHRQEVDMLLSMSNRCLTDIHTDY